MVQKRDWSLGIGDLATSNCDETFTFTFQSRNCLSNMVNRPERRNGWPPPAGMRRQARLQQAKQSRARQGEVRWGRRWTLHFSQRPRFAHCCTILHTSVHLLQTRCWPARLFAAHDHSYCILHVHISRCKLQIHCTINSGFSLCTQKTKKALHSFVKENHKLPLQSYRPAQIANRALLLASAAVPKASAANTCFASLLGFTLVQTHCTLLRFKSTCVVD